jgi:hypothetical protein
MINACRISPARISYHPKQRVKPMKYDELEQAVLAAIRAMDDTRKIEMRGLLEDVAKEFPQEPRLRLVHSAVAPVPLQPASKEAG